MKSLRGLRPVLVVGAAALLMACSDGVPEPIVEGRSGGPLRDEGCDWTLAPSNTSTGVSFSATRVTGSAGSGVWPSGSDDPVWVSAMIPCIDAPTVVFGGVDEAADSVVLQRSDGVEVPLDLFAVEDRSWQAVFGELPPRFFTDEQIFDVEIVVTASGEELARDTLRGLSG